MYGMGLGPAMAAAAAGGDMSAAMMEPEIAERLESLCLSMTEHALGNVAQSSSH